ncbi:hypothetical protein NDU88_001585 [Pleurodeles waltl]|uniref:Uncharacterized protein n=1 Tax=Pleurodeles waltl TaxID=8319 RepID=A0AAV7KZ00_PLEWA|nr:hypothetical protein NDU88_001585 [Pleurodeles waltl]
MSHHRPTPLDAQDFNRAREYWGNAAQLGLQLMLPQQLRTGSFWQADWSGKIRRQEPRWRLCSERDVLELGTRFRRAILSLSIGLQAKQGTGSVDKVFTDGVHLKWVPNLASTRNLESHCETREQK